MTNEKRKQQKIERLAYRIPAAAAMLDVSTPMLYKMIRNGEIDTIKVGTVLRVTRSSIERLVNETGR